MKKPEYKLSAVQMMMLIHKLAQLIQELLLLI